ncbi:MAG: S8 family serine peptidase [Opitutales bacterium]
MKTIPALSPALLLALCSLTSLLSATESGEACIHPAQLRVTLLSSIELSPDTIDSIREIRGSRALVENVNPKSLFFDVIIPEGSQLDSMIEKYAEIPGVQEVSKIQIQGYVKGRLIVGFEKAVSKETALERIQSLEGAKVDRYFKSIHMFVIEIPETVSLDKAMRHYIYKEGVKYVEVDGLVSI